jgi:acetaldehyde dehydrogenase/alcohol dehydrogenase
VPRSIAALGISREQFELAMPDLVKVAFDDPSWRSNPRMPLVKELMELYWAAYRGRGVQEAPAAVTSSVLKEEAFA